MGLRMMQGSQLNTDARPVLGTLYWDICASAARPSMCALGPFSMDNRLISAINFYWKRSALDLSMDTKPHNSLQ